MKKVFFALAVVAMFSFVACNGNAEATDTTPAENTEMVEENTEATTEEATEATEECAEATEATAEVAE